MTLLHGLAAGLLFGAGLAVSGMIYPTKVLGFLDLAGAWDPSLALVMGGALAVAIPGFRFVLARGRTVSGAALAVPAARAIDRPLLVGAVMFGAGWGLVGLCPGPAVGVLATLDPGAALFMAAMLVGMFGKDLVERARGRTLAARVD